jgi:peptidyl-prolyl cis-trans isomerase D
MLQSIRDHTQGWFAGLIISLLILSFALWGIHSYFLGAGGSNVVAKVNGVEISKNQLAVAYERLHRQLQMQFNASELPESAEVNLKQRALQTLINMQILQQASLAENYRISTEQVDNFLQAIPDFQINGEFSIARFQQALTATLFTANDFLDLIRTTLLIDQPRLGIIFTSFALPNEIYHTLALVGQERKIQYFIIPQNYFPAQSIVISAENIQAYYAQHQDEFKTPEQISIDYITLSTKGLAEKNQSSEEQLKNFYNENSTSFAAPAAWQLDELILPLAANATKEELEKARIKMDEVIKAAHSGKDFASLAKQYSLNKGDEKLHKWTAANQLTPALEKAVLGLTKQGQISKPVMLSNGLVILKVINYKEPQSQPYIEIKGKVKEVYGRQKAEEEFNEIREKLANLTYEHPDNLQSAAKELGLQINSSDLFTQDKGAKDITSNQKVRQIAFSNDVLVLQNNSEVIQISPELVVVLRVKTHVPATIQSLPVVNTQIENKLKAIAIDKKLAEFANDIQRKLQAGQLTPAQLNAQYHFQWNDIGFIGRHATKIDQAILDAAFEMPNPAENKMTYTTEKVLNGIAVIGLSAVKEGNVNVAKEQYQAFAEQIQNSEGTLEYELYKTNLVKQAKVVTEEN